METTVFRIVQISDVHLFEKSEGTLLGVNTYESFKSVINTLSGDVKKPNLVLLSGDLSQDGSEAAYLRLVEAMKKIHCPIHWVPGNHDDMTTMARALHRQNIFSHKHILLENWQLILLNSQKPGAVEGYLDQTELNYLQKCLQTHPKHYALIVFHHQPLPVGCQWLDRLGITNADAFWQVVTQFPNVRIVLCGHVHQEHEWQYQNIHCYGTPSTCIQFKKYSENFALEKLAPAYRWVDLYATGRFETSIQRADFIPEFDAHAKGY